MRELRQAGEKKSTRDGYGEALLRIGEADSRIVTLDADLPSSTRTAKFGQKYPERFFNVGIAEQNLYSVAAGLAACGKIPFASTFAVFATERALNQIKQCIAYPALNVKIVTSPSGGIERTWATELPDRDRWPREGSHSLDESRS